jgi:uncharacterized protein (DUF58 family)
VSGIQPSQSTARDLLHPEVLAGLKNLDLVARSVVEGFLIGLHRSPTFGFSQEFAEYRAYAEGDDPRFIDWNVYARTEKTYIKRFLGDTNSHLMILLDASASMGFGGPPVSKLRYGQFLAASLSFLAARQHDAVGCMIDEEVRDYRQPSSRAGKMQGILHCIDSAEAAVGTRFDKPFDKFREQVTRRRCSAACLARAGRHPVPGTRYAGTRSGFQEQRAAGRSRDRQGGRSGTAIYAGSLSRTHS